MSKPGIKSKPRSARKAKAELRVVQSVKSNPAPSPNFLTRLWARLTRVFGRA